MTWYIIWSERYNLIVAYACAYISSHLSSFTFAKFFSLRALEIPCGVNRSFTLVCYNPKCPVPLNLATSNLEAIDTICLLPQVVEEIFTHVHYTPPACPLPSRVEAVCLLHALAPSSDAPCYVHTLPNNSTRRLRVLLPVCYHHRTPPVYSHVARKPRRPPRHRTYRRPAWAPLPVCFQPNKPRAIGFGPKRSNFVHFGKDRNETEPSQKFDSS
jgi:hypothetical protein